MRILRFPGEDEDTDRQRYVVLADAFGAGAGAENRHELRRIIAVQKALDAISHEHEFTAIDGRGQPVKRTGRRLNDGAQELRLEDAEFDLLMASVNAYMPSVPRRHAEALLDALDFLDAAETFELSATKQPATRRAAD